MTTLITKHLGRRDFIEVWREMQQVTDRRGEQDADQLWFVEHDPVFTLGINADPADVLAAGSVPVVATDRGGQVTYHGPGQQVVYVLIRLRRFGLGIRSLVETLERSIIDAVGEFGVEAYARRDAPGVYVDGQKLGAIGLRVRRGCSYHGIAVNVDMDLEPFGRINPCGMSGLAVTQLATLCGAISMDEFRIELESAMRARLIETAAG